MKTAVFSAKPFEVDAMEKANVKQTHQLVYLKEQLNENTVTLAEGCQAIAAFSNDNLSAPVLDKLSGIGIKHITLRSAGYDHVDLKHATKLGMLVANVPEYSPYSIGEHAVTMMMNLNRKIRLADRRLRAYNFELDPLVGFDMHGKTVGIIGTGKIGAVVVRILHGFGCKLLGYDVNKDEKLTEKYGLQYVSIEELLENSDIISLHCPLNESTKCMINADAISKMKKGVMLINTSRGAIVSTEDAIKGVESGHIGYLGLDVYENEKGLFFYDHSDQPGKDPLLNRLLEFDNVLVTGHQAFLTETALRNIAETSLYNLGCFEKGQSCPNLLS
ncbi:2-hydroxyacid dehydrogenase [Cytophagaceae bacterium ABcell3]|nr:2-hydroxyacid dehydrogenase [Cytophagaceae bacterium ABcell3]